MRSSWRPFVWMLLHMVLLLSLFSQLQLLTFWLVMIPLVALFIELKWQRFLLYYIVGSLVLIIALNWYGFFAALVSLYLLPTAIVMGASYKKRTSAQRVLISGSLTMLGQLLLTLLIISLSGINVTVEVQRMMSESIAVWPEYLRSMFNEEMQELVVRAMIQMMPYYFICFSVLIVSITHTLGRRLMNRFAGTHMPGFPPVRDWKMRKSLVWYFVVALLVDFFVKLPPEHMITMILRNLVPLLTLVFSIQAISFLFYVAYKKGWNRSLPIVCAVVMVVFPFVQFLLSILGVLDVVLPIRDRVADNK